MPDMKPKAVAISRRLCDLNSTKESFRKTFCLSQAFLSYRRQTIAPIRA